jgi:hypothetical protein
MPIVGRYFREVVPPPVKVDDQGAGGGGSWRSWPEGLGGSCIEAIIAG